MTDDHAGGAEDDLIEPQTPQTQTGGPAAAPSTVPSPDAWRASAISDTKTFFRYFASNLEDRQWGLNVTSLGTSSIRPGEAYPPRCTRTPTTSTGLTAAHCQAITWFTSLRARARTSGVASLGAPSRLRRNVSFCQRMAPLRARPAYRVEDIGWASTARASAICWRADF